MQPWLLAVAAPGGQKARQMEGSPRICRLQPLCRGTQSNGLDFTFDTSWTTRFELFGLVPDQTFHYRHTSRRKTQRLALDQDSSELDAVQQSLSNQAAGSTGASLDVYLMNSIANGAGEVQKRDDQLRCRHMVAPTT